MFTFMLTARKGWHGSFSGFLPGRNSGGMQIRSAARSSQKKTRAADKMFLTFAVKKGLLILVYKKGLWDPEGVKRKKGSCSLMLYLSLRPCIAPVIEG